MLATLLQIDFQTLGIVVASAGVIFALLFNFLNYRNTRLSNSARMVLDLSHKFDSSDMREKRKQFAKSLMANRDLINLWDDAPVLNFFEEVAYMTRRGILDKGMVWNSFVYWVQCYYEALVQEPNLIKKVESEPGGSTVFSEFVWLR